MGKSENGKKIQQTAPNRQVENIRKQDLLHTTAFCRLKGRRLCTKRWPFASQNATFYKALEHKQLRKQ